MDDHTHLDRKDDSETAGLINAEGHHHHSGSERLHEMKRISQLITDVSSQSFIKGQDIKNYYREPLLS
jgi:hypothetical protein